MCISWSMVQPIWYKMILFIERYCNKYFRMVNCNSRSAWCRRQHTNVCDLIVGTFNFRRLFDHWIELESFSSISVIKAIYSTSSKIS